MGGGRRVGPRRQSLSGPREPTEERTGLEFGGGESGRGSLGIEAELDDLLHQVGRAPQIFDVALVLCLSGQALRFPEIRFVLLGCRQVTDSIECVVVALFDFIERNRKLLLFLGFLCIACVLQCRHQPGIGGLEKLYGTIGILFALRSVERTFNRRQTTLLSVSFQQGSVLFMELFVLGILNRFAPRFRTADG